MALIATDPDSTLIPTNADGAPYYCAFVRPDGSALFADTLTELVAEMIDDYPNAAPVDGTIMDSDDALIARIDALTEQAASAQAVVAAAAVSNGRRFSEDELTALFSAKDQPVDVETWEDDATPLLLLATSFSPHTATVAPTGAAVTILDATTERTFLEGVAALSGSELLLQGA